MSIAADLMEYARTWQTLTGHAPSAVPITTDEARLLCAEMTEYCEMRKAESDTVPTFNGMDIYVTPDAKYRRDLIMEKK